MNTKKSSIWLYGSVFFISCGVFISQIALSIILGFHFNYDFRFLSTSLAILGLGIGGVAGFFIWEKIKFDFSKKICLIAFSYLATTTLPFLVVSIAIPTLVAVFVTSTINFFLAGLFLALIFTQQKSFIYKLYFADLLGAASAGVVMFFITDLLGMESAIILLFLIGIAAFVSCWIFYYGYPNFRHTLIFVGSITFLFLISFIKLPTDLGCPQYPGVIKEQSNSFSYLRMQLLQRNKDALAFRINVNCRAITTTGYITKNVKSIKNSLVNFHYIPFMLNNHRNVLILGSGAGIDVSRALLAGSSKITAVEINPLMISFSNSFPASIGQSAYQNKRVKAVVSEARSYVIRSKEKYDLILIAYTKYFGSPIGIQLFTPKNLYTKEAFSAYIDKLSDNGILAVLDDNLFMQQDVKTLASILAKNKLDKNRHLIVVPSNEEPYNIEWMFFKKNGFSSHDRALVENEAEKYGTSIKANDKITFESDAITDDKPFFQLKDNLILITPVTALPIENIVRNFLILSVLSIVITLGSILALMLKIPSAGKREFAMSIFFVGISVGLAALEFTLISKMTLLLGNPIYSHILILAAILLFGGFGSLAASSKKINKNLKKLGLFMAIMMLVYFIIFDKIISIAVPLDNFSRMLIVFGLVIPPSFISGIFFPAGLKKVSKPKDMLLPWSWGIDTLAFVTAGLIITFAVLFIGIKIMFVIGSIGYLFAAITSDSLEHKKSRDKS